MQPVAVAFTGLDRLGGTVRLCDQRSKLQLLLVLLTDVVMLLGTADVGFLALLHSRLGPVAARNIPKQCRMLAQSSTASTCLLRSTHVALTCTG